MLLIPAIDIKDGQCVRLRQGKVTEKTVYADNPLDMAERWVKAGARRLHLVDLDGAFSGKPVNIDIVCDIVSKFPNIPVQVGGGIRDVNTIQKYLSAGVKYIIIGTKAVTTPHFISDVCLEFPRHIIVGIDAKNGKLATDGWSKLSHHDAVDMAKRFEEDGVNSIIFTDISHDGMMNNINIEATLELCRHVTIPVIASGGIANLDDIRVISESAEEGIEGAIIGTAIYEGKIDFAEAQELANQICPPHNHFS